MFKTRHGGAELRVTRTRVDNVMLNAALQLLSLERRLCGLLRRDNCGLIEDRRRLQSQVDTQNELIARLQVYIDRVKREYLIPPYHDSTASHFLNGLWEGENDDEA